MHLAFDSIVHWCAFLKVFARVCTLHRMKKKMLYIGNLFYASNTELNQKKSENTHEEEKNMSKRKQKNYPGVYRENVDFCIMQAWEKYDRSTESTPSEGENKNEMHQQDKNGLNEKWYNVL